MVGIPLHAQRHILIAYRLFAFIDRSNIGNAKIDGLVKDLHLTGNKFNIALVVFYVPYVGTLMTVIYRASH